LFDAIDTDDYNLAIELLLQGATNDYEGPDGLTALHTDIIIAITITKLINKEY